MKRILLTLFLLLFCTPALAFSPAIQAVLGMGAAADGPNVWYYSCTATPLVEPTWTGYLNEPNTTASCQQIALGAGTLTKLSVKASETYAETEKLALYDTSGNLLSVACTTGTFVNDTWMDCTLGTPYTVSAATYNICGMVSVNNAYIKYLSSTTSWFQESLLYASFPYATLTLGTGISCIAFRAYVD